MSLCGPTRQRELLWSAAQVTTMLNGFGKDRNKTRDTRHKSIQDCDHDYRLFPRDEHVNYDKHTCVFAGFWSFEMERSSRELARDTKLYR